MNKRVTLLTSLCLQCFLLEVAFGEPISPSSDIIIRMRKDAPKELHKLLRKKVFANQEYLTCAPLWEDDPVIETCKWDDPRTPDIDVVLTAFRLHDNYYGLVELYWRKGRSVKSWSSADPDAIRYEMYPSGAGLCEFINKYLADVYCNQCIVLFIPPKRQYKWADGLPTERDETIRYMDRA